MMAQRATTDFIGWLWNGRHPFAIKLNPANSPYFSFPGSHGYGAANSCTYAAARSFDLPSNAVLAGHHVIPLVSLRRALRSTTGGPSFLQPIRSSTTALAGHHRAPVTGVSIRDDVITRNGPAKR